MKHKVNMTDDNDVLSKRLATVDESVVSKQPPPPLLKAVYIGGPSAVGKSTAMNKIKSTYRWARVANVNFRNLFTLYGGDTARAVHHLLYCRNEPMIYEHTDECTALYRVVHRHMRGAELTKEIVQSCYRDCVNALTNPSSSTLIVMLDTTKSYLQRYEHRLATDYNGIDYRDTRYLYLQVAAYLAFLTKRHLYPFMRVLIATDDYNNDTGPPSPRVFGKPDDYDLVPLLHGLIDAENDTVVETFDFDEVSKTVADCHISRADESLDLS